MRYEYYIHYIALDRRNDRWVTEQCLKIDPEEIHRLELTINKEEEDKTMIKNLARERSQYLYNDENHGMSDKDVAEFLQATRIKTVESI